jgi:hypothetical protein
MNESENAQDTLLLASLCTSGIANQGARLVLGKLQFCSEIAKVLWLASA